MLWRTAASPESMWCCATWGDVDEDKRLWSYPKPPDLTGA